MPFAGRVALLGTTALLTACLLTSCSSGPSATQRKSARILTTTTTIPPTTSTTSSSSTTTQPGVAIPNVVGLKIAAARVALRAAGFPAVNLNPPCNKDTLASQSVVASLALPGKPPDVRVGAVPLSPGTAITPGTRVGIIWSGCFGDASAVPAVVGLTFPAARAAIHAVGLSWACFSVGKPTTTTTVAPESTDSTTTTPALVTTTTVKVTQTVLTQSPAAHTVLHPGATVTLTMHRCPQ